MIAVFVGILVGWCLSVAIVCACRALGEMLARRAAYERFESPMPAYRSHADHLRLALDSHRPRT